MTLQIHGKLVILTFILLAVILFAWVAWEFNQVTSQSERHNYYYTIDLSCNTTIENVTLLLPVPGLNTAPLFIPSLLNGTAYGVSPDWNLSVVSGNGTPMLSIRAARMVPEYHGYPIAIEPGTTVLPTTLVPSHEILERYPGPHARHYYRDGNECVGDRHPQPGRPRTALFPGRYLYPGILRDPGLRWSDDHQSRVYQLYVRTPRGDYRSPRVLDRGQRECGREG